MYINGTWVDTDHTFDVTNPANGEVIGQVPDASAAQIDEAIGAAHEAFFSWRRTTAYERSALLYRAWQLMMEQKRELAELMTREQGKPLKASLNEVQYGADFLLWFAEEAKRLYGQSIPSARPDQRFWVQQQPVGVVGAITPLELPHFHDHPQGGPGPCCRLHRGTQACGKHPAVRHGHVPHL